MRNAVSMFVVVVATISASLAHADNMWGDKAPFIRTACHFQDFYASSVLLAKPESKYWYHISIVDESSRGFFSKEYQYTMSIIRRMNKDRHYKKEVVTTVSFKRKTANKYVLISSESLPMPSLGQVVMLEKDKISNVFFWLIRTASGEQTNYRCGA